MSVPPVDQSPPAMGVSDQPYRDPASHTSVGPVIGVVAVIAVLGVVAGMIGRLCSGRRVMGRNGSYYDFDFEGWLERKCATCIDGSVDPPPRPRAPVAAPAELRQPEAKEEPEEQEDEDEEEEEEEQTQQHSQSHSHANASTSES